MEYGNELELRNDCELKIDTNANGNSIIGIRDYDEHVEVKFLLDNVNDYDKVIGLLIEQRELLNKKKEGK